MKGIDVVRKLIATGFEGTLEEDAPTLFVSGGGGNTPRAEVHLHLFDDALGAEVGAWFNAAELLDALREATA